MLLQSVSSRPAGRRWRAEIRRDVMLAFGGRLPSLTIIVITLTLTSGTPQAQDLDRDKSGAKLFAATCGDCHRSPRGLARDRFSWTLSYFLQQHYTSSPASAQALAAYLQSVDAPRAKPQSATRKSRPSATSTSEPSLRPPASVPPR
jgi:mono/diheme cytochrome c family protein